MGQNDRLIALYDRYDSDLNFHMLRKPGVKIVPGSGQLNPILMLIGEAPGKLENARGAPFLGAAGNNLDKFLANINVNKEDTFKTNVIKYWPRLPSGSTRPPYKEEIEDSRDYLLEEIDIVNPLLVGLLGFYAINTVFPSIRSVFAHHGKLLENKFVPLYHPAVTLYQPAKEDLVRSGFDSLSEYIDRLSGGFTNVLATRTKSL